MGLRGPFFHPYLLCKFDRRDVSEGRVRTLLIVVLLPCGETGACLAERCEERLVQELVPQPPVEAFDESVLGRLARRDVVPADVPLLALAQDRHAGQFGPIVRYDGFWSASLGDDRIQLPRHALA